MWVQQVPWPLTWAVLQLSWQAGWLLEVPNGPWRPLTFSPASLTVSEGANATFTCSFSNWSKDLMLNWYRLSPSNQTQKQAAFCNGFSQPVQDSRFQITQLPNGHDFHMNILTTRRNDSGIYLCGAISLPPNAQIKESPGAELVVTERILETSTRYPSPSPRPAGQFQGLVIGLMSVLVGVPVLLLLAWVLAAFCPTETSEARRAGSKEQSLKQDPSAAPVYSVAYEELAFQGREKTPELPTPCVHTEYATIVFTEGLGASSLGRRGSADGPQGPQPPRHEDGHYSWPL
ncbi:programmed cell death protein 1 [Onychomys torridus]|uniref:programmed cell death protein 1 n=1 Tax=Onychomys torridus TaxID=38674 RepID=UPI00167FCC12|nr:programmed cell death protein 1 [Onychomys torridus]XP_036028596.1 programmed cell death protein 1 [Onychomys torridus]XP_036028597.1 programmed cell death protein 1 [Onychomys torridus]